MKKFKLDEHSKMETGFTTPDNYFEEFSQVITKKIETQPKVISIFSSQKKWLYAAAAVVVFGLFIPFYNGYQEKETAEELSSIETYIENNNLSHYDLIDEIPESVIEEFEAELNDI
jgi:cell division protein FtsL